MTSVSLQPASLTGVLWPKHPTIRETGLVVDFTLNDPTPAAHRLFTAVAFHPTDEHTFCFGDSAGAVYVATLAKNRYTLTTRTPQPVSSIAFVNFSNAIAVASGLIAYVVNTDTAKVMHKLRGPHSNRILKVVAPPLMRGVAATLSADALAFWNVNTGAALSVEHQPASFVDMATHGETLYTLSADGSVKAWSYVDRKCATSVHLTNVAAKTIACSAHYVICGTDGPRVAVMRAQTLRPLWLTQVHGEAGNISITHCGSNVFACTQSDGLVSFIAVGDVATDPVRAEGITVGQSLELCVPANHVPVTCAGSNSHYAAVVSTASLQVFHLPRAKEAHDKLARAQQLIPGRPEHERACIKAFVGIRPASDQSAAAPTADDESAAATDPAPLPKSPMPPPTAEAMQRHWLKVNLLQSSERQSKSTGEALFASDAVKQRYGEAVAAAKKSAGPQSDAGSTSTAVPVSRAAAADGTQSMAAAASVQKLQRQAPKPTAAAIGTPTPRRPTSKATAVPSLGASSQFDSISSVSFDSFINLRSLADAESRVVNLDKLRGLLMRYGAFPERFRTYIWRFLLDLGSKDDTAPLFAVLAARGVHPGTASLMQPFPLPDNRLRNALQKALSCLAHHAPVFAVAHFIPSLVFPFVSVFHSDVQSSVEAVLAFTTNWGKEFFQYYPHMPVAVGSLVSHLLQAEDKELYDHLHELGVGPELYVWDVLSAVYTEILTKNEWLQLMDHVLSNEPLWMYLWHVRWLCHMKPALMCLKDPANIASMFRRATPFEMNSVLQQTYRLHGRCPRNDLTKPYETFTRAPSGEYPRPLEVHESVVTSRLEELRQIEQHEAQVMQLHERTRMIEKQLADAAMTEDAFVARQRALVSAKYDGASALWSQRVTLEQERNRLREIEHEARLKAVQAQLTASERLEHVQSDLNIASVAARQAALDREQEAMKWNFADRMANVEVERLEAAALARLHGMVRGTTTTLDTPSPVGLRNPSEPTTERRTSHPTSSSERDRPEQAAPRVHIGVRSSSREQQGGDLGASIPPQPHRNGPPAPTPRRSADRTPDSATAASRSQPRQPLFDPLQEDNQPTSTGRPSANLERSRDSDDGSAASQVSQTVVPATSLMVSHVDPSASSVTVTVTPSRGALPPIAATPSTAGRTNSTSASHQTGGSSSSAGATTSESTHATTTDTTGTTTSTLAVTSDCDAHSHFQQLHIEIRQRVEQAQREQRAALAALRSRYANATASVQMANNQTSSTAEDQDDGVSDNTEVTEMIEDEEEDDGSQFTTESTGRSSMVETLMRPQGRGMYHFARRS